MSSEQKPASQAFKGTARFRVQEQLGEGGMGVVYRAYDKERDEWVALKTLSEIRPGALYRFKREFRLLADVAHPNLALLYELVSSDDSWFLTMELVDGVDFLAYVREPVRDTGPQQVVAAFGSGPGASSAYRSRSPEVGARGTDESAETEDPTVTSDATATSPQDVFLAVPISPTATPQAPPANIERLRPALRQLAAALHWIHQAGYVHRDVKPSNVLVTEAGRVVVLDFGLVSHIRAARYAMAVHGRTLGYMAPEVAHDASKATPATDWYAFGTILYEALAGWRPFRHQADSKAALALRLRTQPPEPSALRPGVPPDLEQLCCDLLQIDPERRPDGEQILRRLEAPESRAAGTGSSWAAVSDEAAKLVGRDRELKQLRRAWADVRLGQATTVLLRGTSGMGKSSLALRFLGELKDAVVLEGRCYERECVPHKALDSVVDALCGYLAQQPTKTVSELLPEDPAALAQAFPVLQRVPLLAKRADAGAGALETPELRRRAFAALRGLLGNIARRSPLVIFVDDLQWGDVESAPVFLGLMQAPAPPLLLLGSYRSEEVQSSPLLQALLPAAEQMSAAREADGSEQAAGGVQAPGAGQVPGDSQQSGFAAGLVEIEVGGLSQAQAESLAAELLRVRGVGTGAAARVARESGGSPYFIQEFVRYAAAAPELGTGTATVDAMIRGRADGLAEDAKRLLHAVAVAGYRLGQDAAREAAGLGQEQRRAFAELRAGNFIRTAGIGREATVEPYHDRVREALVAAMDGETQRQWHQQLALALDGRLARGDREREGAPVGQRDEDVFALANHYFLGRLPGLGARAYELNYKAGRMAAESFAYERSYQFLDQAQQLARADDTEPDTAFGTLYGEVCGRTQRIQQAVEAFQQTLARSTAPVERAALRLSLSRVHLGRLDAAAAYEEAAQGLLEIGRPPPRSGLLSLLGALGDWLRARRIVANPRRFGSARGEQRQACGLAVQVYFQAGYAAYFDLNMTSMLVAVLRISRPAALLGPSAELAEYQMSVSGVAGAKRRRSLNERAGNRALEIADELGNPVVRARTLLYRAFTEHLLGDTTAAAQRMRGVLDQQERWLQNNDFLTGIADISWNLLMRGYAQEGWSWVQRGLRRAALGAAESRLTEGHTYRCYAGPLLAMLGRPAEGARHLDEFHRLIEDSPDDRWRWAQYLGHRALALVLDDQLGEPFEQAVEAHRRLGLAVGRVPLQLRQFYVAQAYGRLLQHERAPRSEQRRTRRRFKAALRALERLPMHETTDCHRRCIEAAYQGHEGREDRALRMLEASEALVEQTDNAWVRAEIALQRARIARGRSDTAVAREQALLALAFAEQLGWQRRASALRREFGLTSA